ncbi:MarR family winged helix-turn-helix transcriptional regulator [Nocardiopsis synnemataformans]|uniref:MarR family winged helix-turn-helix transcriptional regulator n=1 Tax=Nocardiopsis synnemataformans TaxID=61305 RepID=UPI003EBD74E4
MDPLIRAIDDHLLLLRQAQARPDYRRRLLKGVEGVSGVGTLRVLRSIERAEARGQAPAIGQVARDLEVEQSTASRAINETTKRGLTVRRPCADDQRQVLLELTDLGRQAALRATGNRQEMVAEALADWSEEDVSRFSRLFGAFVEVLSQVEPKEDDIGD